MTTEPTPAEERRAAERRGTLNSVRLRVLARDHLGLEGTAEAMGSDAVLVTGSDTAVLLDEDSPRGLGAALARANRAGSERLHVLAGSSAGVLARQAALFDLSIVVWEIDGDAVVEARPVPRPRGDGPPDAPELVALLRAEGLDVVVEGDRLAAEYRGLEVARVVRALDDGEPILEVGVGRHDRALTAMMHGELDGRASIARVVEQLAAIRRPDPPHHPLATLVPERWMRATVLDAPGLIGCDELQSAPSAEPRDRLRPRGIAAAVGRRGPQEVVVTFAVGVDLEAPVQAADTRDALDPGAILLYVAPRRDLVPVVHDLVSALSGPAEIIAFDGDWRR